jgi:hypothetical protein
VTQPVAAHVTELKQCGLSLSKSAIWPFDRRHPEPVEGLRAHTK